jgi:RNA polymerase sigma factor (sigma-70 family)
VDDQQHIDRVLGGTSAFTPLVRRHQQTVCAVAMSVLKQEDDARDAVQQGFLLAYSNLSKFRGDASFSTWLCRIVINEALRIGRQRKNRTLEEWDEKLPEASPVVNEALANFLQADRAKIIRNFFALMPAREALVLQLFYLEEQSVKETAYCTGLTGNYVKVLLSRGRDRFYSLCQQHPDWQDISSNS